MRLEEVREEIRRLGGHLSKARLDEIMGYVEDYGDERDREGFDRGLDEGLGE